MQVGAKGASGLAMACATNGKHQMGCWYGWLVQDGSILVDRHGVTGVTQQSMACHYVFYVNIHRGTIYKASLHYTKVWHTLLVIRDVMIARVLGP